MNINELIQSALKYFNEGNLREAERACMEALKLQAEHAFLLQFLGAINYELGNHDLSIEYQKRSLESDPGNADVHYDLGNNFREKQELDEAVMHYQKAIELNPLDFHAYYNLGIVFHERKLLDKAIEYYQQTLKLKQDDASIYNNLGTAFHENNMPDAAIDCYQKALAIDPAYPDALNNLGKAFQDKGRLEDAIAYYHKALEVNPEDPVVYVNLGESRKSQGMLDEAEEYYRQAMRLNPDDLIPHELFISLMNYHCRYDAHEIFCEHLKFSRQHLEPSSSLVLPHANDCSTERRLRIGYVSPDFKKHSVAYFIEPVLYVHNHDKYEIFCYSDVVNTDGFTDRIRSYADQWRNISGMPDEEVEEIIRKDRIDILMDLAGYTAGNRIPVFARKPAPIQAGWIGYPATTGLSAMDYRITDNHADPPGMTEQYYVEKLLRLPDCYLCYLPDGDSPEISPLPALESGHVTFGSFNNFAKVSSETLSLWTGILKEIPDSRLLIKAVCFSDEATCQRITRVFADNGIASERIELLPLEPFMRNHLNLYSRADIGLDTFPYHGTTTTCEAMWMGVPVITMTGKSHVSRVGTSLLSNVGLTEFIAGSDDEYIDIAVKLSNDIERLKTFRAGIRDMMISSPLADKERFIVNLEKLYREMWGNWCKSRS
jgi:predicted O-linked N-acetylglucosamine transferase (SPINDLY family)